jgi:hypothetical protein
MHLHLPLDGLFDLLLISSKRGLVIKDVSQALGSAILSFLHYAVASS